MLMPIQPSAQHLVNYAKHVSKDKVAISDQLPDHQTSTVFHVKPAILLAHGVFPIQQDLYAKRLFGWEKENPATQVSVRLTKLSEDALLIPFSVVHKITLAITAMPITATMSQLPGNNAFIAEAMHLVKNPVLNQQKILNLELVLETSKLSPVGDAIR